jgi:hypothetical protein
MPPAEVGATIGHSLPPSAARPARRRSTPRCQVSRAALAEGNCQRNRRSVPSQGLRSQ